MNVPTGILTRGSALPGLISAEGPATTLSPTLRPTVRGSVMNPCDHPHGGGEGRAPIGRTGPVTPWGKPALGYKTRQKHKSTDKYIVKRRNAK